MPYVRVVILAFALLTASTPTSAKVTSLRFETTNASAIVEAPLKVNDGLVISGFIDDSPPRPPQELFAHEVNFTLSRDAALRLAATWFQLPPFGNTFGYKLTGPQGLVGIKTPSLVPLEDRTVDTITASFANLPSGDYALLLGGLLTEDIATYDAKVSIVPIPSAAVLLGTAVAGLGLFARRRRGT